MKTAHEVTVISKEPTLKKYAELIVSSLTEQLYKQAKETGKTSMTLGLGKYDTQHNVRHSVDSMKFIILKLEQLGYHAKYEYNQREDEYVLTFGAIEYHK